MKTLGAILALFFILNTSLFQAQIINTSKSTVNFKITGGGIFTVRGTFTGMEGDFNFNADDLENSSFNICIDAASINTKNKKRDTHLRSEDFFHVAEYPNICFKSTSVLKTDTGYLTKGKLTLHGITKTIEIPFQFKNSSFTGSLELDRFDYEIGKDTPTLKAGKVAKIIINCHINQ